MPQKLRFSSLKELNDEAMSLHKLIMKTPSARMIMPTAQAMPAAAKKYLKKGDQEQAYIELKRFVLLATGIHRLPKVDQEACNTVFDKDTVMDCTEKADKLAGTLERRYAEEKRCETTQLQPRSSQPQQSARRPFLCNCFGAIEEEDEDEVDSVPRVGQAYQKSTIYKSMSDLDHKVQAMHSLIMKTRAESVLQNAKTMPAKAEEFLNRGDCENAYIQLTRFIHLSKDISQLPSVDQEACKNIFNKATVRKSKKKSKELSRILSKRYKTDEGQTSTAVPANISSTK